MSIGCMFAGQGAQVAGMGREQYDCSPAARQVFERADAILGYSISRLCFEGTTEELTPCAICQPAIYTVSVAMYKAYQEKTNASCAVCGGLSLGEFSAACVAGVFGFEDGLKLVAARGRLMDECCQAHPGGMAAVLGGDPEGVATACAKAGIDVANYNCPGQIVISGEDKGLMAAMESLSAQGYRVVKLTVAGAYHSRLMQPAAEAFGKVLADSPIAKPQCGFVQNVEGGLVADAEQIRRNLQLQVCSSVKWEQCVRKMIPLSEQLVEFGPGTALSGFMKRIDRAVPVAHA